MFIDSTPIILVRDLINKRTTARVDYSRLGTPGPHAPRRLKILKGYNLKLTIDGQEIPMPQGFIHES